MRVVGLVTSIRNERMGVGPMSDQAPERTDIQALVRTGFGSLAACFLLLRVTDRMQARAWLAAARPASAAHVETGRLDRAIQIALSAPGLAALGVPTDGFSVEFRQGIAGDPGRSLRLGDVGANAPEHWRWGAAGDEPHLLVMLYAVPGALDGYVDATLGALAPGFTLQARLDNCEEVGREPFGFADGVSQPTLDWTGTRRPGGKADRSYTNLISAGEILLGYRDEYDIVADRPLLADGPRRRDLGRNGSYLVLRRLAQDVPGFWNWARAEAGPAGARELAEAVVGRRLDGAPLEGLPQVDVPGVDDPAANGFTYAHDDAGHVCPFGGHIRRANPRSGDLPGGPHGIVGALLATFGLTGTAQGDAIASTRFHRLLRRGRAYGTPTDAARAIAGEDDGAERGLNFLCLGASLARQFEFVQGAWLNNARFAGLSGEADPLTASRAPFPAGHATDSFTRPKAAGPCERFTGLPRFVTVTGGAYFFLPGLTALRWIAGQPAP